MLLLWDCDGSDGVGAPRNPRHSEMQRLNLDSPPELQHLASRRNSGIIHGKARPAAPWQQVFRHRSHVSMRNRSQMHTEMLDSHRISRKTRQTCTGLQMVADLGRWGPPGWAPTLRGPVHTDHRPPGDSDLGGFAAGPGLGLTDAETTLRPSAQGFILPPAPGVQTKPLPFTLTAIDQMHSVGAPKSACAPAPPWAPGLHLRGLDTHDR